MSFFQNIFGTAKNIVNKGKDVLSDQLSSETTYERGVGITSDTGNKPKLYNTSKDFLFPGRGYSDEQIKEAEYNKKDTVIGLAKGAGEIAKGTVDLVSILGRTIANKTLPGYKEQTERPEALAFRESVDNAINSKLQPSNASQAKVMRGGDILGVAPVGSISKLSKLSKLDKLSDVSTNSLKLERAGVRESSLDFLRKNPDEITKGEVRFRELEDGTIHIEDGRHRLEVGRELGITPTLVDVTSEYTGAPSSKIAGIIDDIKQAPDTPIKKAEAPVVKDVKAFDIKKPTPVTKPIERAYSKRVAAMMPEADGVGSTYAQRRSTEELAQKAQNLIKEDPVSVDRMMTELKSGTKNTKIGENHIAVASELLNDIQRRAEAATDITTKNKLYDEAAELANSTAQNLTQLGRDVQAASILQRVTPAGQVRFAAKEIQKYNAKNPTKIIPELSGKQTSHISSLMEDLKKLPEGSIERKQKFFEVQQYISSVIPNNDLAKKIANTWKAGLLTGLKTTGLNILSNTAHFGMEVIKDAPAAIVDKAASLFTGERTKTLTMRKAFDGMKEGAINGKRYFSTGFDERNIGEKLDYHRVNYGKGPVAKAFQGYTDTVFRAIGAQDQPFYYSTLSRSLMDQALATGKNQGLKGKELVENAYKLVDNPTEEMIRYATMDATTAVFQNKTALGAAAKTIQNIPYVGQFIVPFAQTPSAVAMQIINYSPVGVVKTIIENAGKGKFDQRLFSQGIGRGIVGTAPLAIGAALYDTGMISLDYPQGDSRMIELNKAEGQTYNAIKIGDEWRGLNTLGPAGQLVLMGAYFKKALSESGSPSEAMVMAATGALASFSEQTFLTGAKNFMDAVSDPLTYGRDYLPNLAASFIPTIVSDTARSVDGEERVTSAPGFIDTFGTKAAARVPGLRDNLEPQVSSLGEQIPLGGNAVETMLDATRPSDIRSTEVTTELRRMQDLGFAVAPTKVGNKKGYDSLSPEQNTKMWEMVGTLVNEKLTSLVTNSKYTALTNEQKEEKITQFVDKAKIIGRAQFILLQTDGLSLEETKSLLGAYKGNIMTEQVFTEYMKLRKGE